MARAMVTQYGMSKKLAFQNRLDVYTLDDLDRGLAEARDMFGLMMDLEVVGSLDNHLATGPIRIVVRAK